MTSDIVEIEQLLHRYCHSVDRGPPHSVSVAWGLSS